MHACMLLLLRVLLLLLMVLLLVLLLLLMELLLVVEEVLRVRGEGEPLGLPGDAGTSGASSVGHTRPTKVRGREEGGRG